MITNCPECGELLKRQWHTAPTLESYFCPNNNIKYKNWEFHYEVVYKEKNLYSIYRLLNINDKFFLFISNKDPTYTKIFFFKNFIKGNDILYHSEEFITTITTIDEFEFTKKILRMKAFL